MLASPGTRKMCVIEIGPAGHHPADADPVPFLAAHGVLTLQDHARADVGGGSDRAAERLLVGCPGFDLRAFRRSASSVT